MAAFLAIPYTFFTVLPEVMRGFDEIKNYTILRNSLLNFSIIVSLLVLYTFSEYNNEPILALFIGVSLSTIIAFLVVIIFLKKKNIPFKSPKYNKSILKYSYPMFLTSSVLFLMSNLDTFMIGFFIDEKSVGIYSACLKVSLAVTFILASVTGFIAPKISKAFHLKKFNEVKRIYNLSLKLTVFATIPIVILILAFPELILSLFGEEFIEYKNLLYVVVFMNISNVLFGPLIYMLNMMDSQNFVKNVLFISLGINVLINYYWIQYYGIIGAAMATVVSTVLWKTILFIKLKTILKTSNTNEIS